MLTYCVDIARDTLAWTTTELLVGTICASAPALKVTCSSLLPPSVHPPSCTLYTPLSTLFPPSLHPYLLVSTLSTPLQPPLSTKHKY